MVAPQRLDYVHALGARRRALLTCVLTMDAPVGDCCAEGCHRAERISTRLATAVGQEKTFRTGDNSIARLFEGAAQELIARTTCCHINGLRGTHCSMA